MSKNTQSIITTLLIIIGLLFILVITCTFPFLVNEMGPPWEIAEDVWYDLDFENNDITLPYDPPDPVVVSDETAFFFDEGLTFEMPFGFVVEDPRIYASIGGTHFDYYYRNYERGAQLRIRHLDFSTSKYSDGEMAVGDRLQVFVDSYIYITIGKEATTDTVTRLSQTRLTELGADDGWTGTYDTPAGTEYVLFLGKKPGHIYHISILLETYNIIDSSIIMSTFEETVNLKDEKIVREIEALDESDVELDLATLTKLMEELESK